MKKIGITGGTGFIGSHLYNRLLLEKNKFSVILCNTDQFSDSNALENFVKDVDVIVHLAALNRHNDPNEIYRINTELVKKLIAAVRKTGGSPHILFSSSTQEERDNAYGRSKKAGRELFEKWAEKYGGRFTGLIIPNVYGPFGKPFYNSFISTFSYQLTHNQQPRIEVDAEIGFIYVDDLIKEIVNLIDGKDNGCNTIRINETYRAKVTDILNILINFKEEYFEKGIIPLLENNFKINLFNTFRSYIDINTFFPFSLKTHVDERGLFAETVKLHSGGQVSFSTTKAGIERGNHFHTRKIERFAVIKGEALIKLRKIGSSHIYNFKLSGDSPAFVDMPVWYTHNIKNTGDEELITIFWINEFYNSQDPDTWFETVE